MDGQGLYHTPIAHTETRSTGSIVTNLDCGRVKSSYNIDATFRTLKVMPSTGIENGGRKSKLLISYTG